MEQIQHLYGGQDNQSVASSSRIPADYGDLEDQLRAALDCIQTLEAAAARPLSCRNCWGAGQLGSRS